MRTVPLSGLDSSMSRSNRIPLCLAASAAFLAAAPVVLAWNGTGHEVVAQIAWDQLTPPQRAAYVDLLKAHPRYEKDLMQNLQPGEDPGEHAFREAATWPDQVKSPVNPLERTEDHKPWHYVDYPYDLDGKQGPMPAEQWDGHTEPTDLLQAMQMVTAQLRDPATAAARKAIDVCWVLHLVGDVHQPLHAVSEYSNLYPDGDQGGNAIHVSTDDNPDTNLHSVWDGIEGGSYDPDAIHKTAARIEAAFPRATDGPGLAVTDPKAWALESLGVAKHAVYLDGKVKGVTRDQAQADPAAVPFLPVGYEHEARKAADARIALAGYRLAALLQSLPEATAGPSTSATTRVTTRPAGDR